MLMLIETTWKMFSHPREKFQHFFVELTQNVKYLLFTALSIQIVTSDKK